jgi:hypothetical protein
MPKLVGGNKHHVIKHYLQEKDWSAYIIIEPSYVVVTRKSLILAARHWQDDRS